MKIYRISYNPRVFSDTEKQNIVQEFKNGLPIEDLNSKYRSNLATLRNIIVEAIGEFEYQKELKLQKEKRDQLRRKISDEKDVKQIVELFINGHTQSSIARQFDTSQNTIVKLLVRELGKDKVDEIIKAKIYKSPITGYTIDGKQQEIVDLFLSGKTLTYIAEEMGIIRQTIKKVLIDNLSLKTFNEILEKQKRDRLKKSQPKNIFNNHSKIKSDINRLQNELYDPVREAYINGNMSIEDIATTFDLDIQVLMNFIEKESKTPFFKKR